MVVCFVFGMCPGDSIGGVVTWSAFVYLSRFVVGRASATEVAKLNTKKPLSTPHKERHGRWQSTCTKVGTVSYNPLITVEINL